MWYEALGLRELVIGKHVYANQSAQYYIMTIQLPSPMLEQDEYFTSHVPKRS